MAITLCLRIFAVVFHVARQGCHLKFIRVLTLFFGLSAFEYLSASDYYVTPRLLQDCQQSIDIWEGRDGDSRSAAMCLGFVNGILMAQDLYRLRLPGCRPDAIPAGAVAYALTRYVDRHPEAIGKPASDVIELVLSRMYACETTKTTTD